MAFLVRNLIDNDDIILVQSLGAFDIVEYERDLSVDMASAQTAYFASKMNVRRRQAIAKLNNSAVTVQAGAMQWTVGNVSLTSGVKGAGDLLGKMLRSTVTGESAIKPEYSGSGLVALEPTYKHLLAVDLADWNGSIVVEDGMFLACESTVQQKLVLVPMYLLPSPVGRGFSISPWLVKGLSFWSLSFPAQSSLRSNFTMMCLRLMVPWLSHGRRL